MIKKLALKGKQQTVFSFNDIAQIIEKSANQNLISAINYYVKKGDLIRLSKGLYSLDSSYSSWELGNKLRTPSYVSLYSVLQKSGIVFQPYESIFLVGNRSETIEIDGQKYVYRKIKDSILLNNLGIIVKNNVSVGTPERAFLDKLYLDGEEYFDNLSKIDWNLVEKLNKEVYKSKLIKRYIRTEKNEKLKN